MPKEPVRECRKVVCTSSFVDAEELLTFTHLTEYTESFTSLGLTDDEQRCIEIGIMLNPTLPPVIEGTGGVREFQFSTPSSNPGSLHLSAFYAYFPETAKVALIDVMETDDVGPMTDQEKAALKEMFEQIQEFGPEAWET